MTFALLLLVFQQNFHATADPRFDVTCPQYIRRAVVVSPEDFSLQTVQGLARDFLIQNRRSAIAKLTIATSREYLAYYSGKGSTDSNFDGWQHQISSERRQGWEPLQDIAEVLVVDGEAVLRIRRSGKITRVVLTAHDPLELGGEGDSEILDVSGLATPGMPEESSCLDHLSFFVKTSAGISESLLAELAKQLHRFVPGVDVFLSVRNDAWFISHSDFPPVYAFSQGLDVDYPTQESYARANERVLYQKR